MVSMRLVWLAGWFSGEQGGKVCESEGLSLVAVAVCVLENKALRHARPARYQVNPEVAFSKVHISQVMSLKILQVLVSA